MNRTELLAKLAELDAEIKEKRGEVEDAQLDLKHLAEKRRAFANRNCPHEATYQRSVMGREIDTYCKDCGECIS